MNLQNIKRQLLLIPGWRTKRKIVVIESDDWGSIRMPSRDIYSYLKRKGYQPEIDPYLKYDCLASEEDLVNLFEILISIKDSNGKPAVITANSVMANPDFDKIRANDFQNYYYEPFTKTLANYSNHNNSFNLWKQGIQSLVFRPQFHAREHINVDQWMHGLRQNDPNLKLAFDLKMISISSVQSKMKYSYMESFDFFSKEEEVSKLNIVREGLDMFEETFGYRSKSFIASCYVWGDLIEQGLKAGGVEYIQGVNSQTKPIIKNSSRIVENKVHFMGNTNILGQKYLVRNVFFEPSHYPEKNNLEECIYRIGLAFKFNKPAIISSHRLNYIGEVDIKNRNDNLILLKKLLSTIVKKWPDVEFISSDELGEIISKND